MAEKSFVYFLNTTGIQNDSQKRAAFLYLVGDEVQDIFETLGDVGTTYEQAIIKLDSHFDIKKNIPFERCVFHEADQVLGENIDSYVTRLKKLIIHCEYGDAAQDEIRDQVIAKCKLSKLRKRLLQEPDLTLDKVLTIGKLMEQSDHQTKKIEQQNAAGSLAEGVKESFSDLNKIRPNKYQNKGKQRDQRNTQQRQKCGRCGMRNHKSQDCRVTKWKKCMKCGIMGHFAKYCKTKAPKKAESHQVRANEFTTESSSDDEAFVFTIGSKERPVYQVSVDGTPIKMLIDSGSTLNIIDETSLQMLKKEAYLADSKAKIFT